MKPDQPEQTPATKLTAADVSHARHEALIVLVVWALATTYSVTYYYLYGYGARGRELRFVLGFPDWIFWGIITPWMVCSVFLIGFSMWYMRDYDWGGENAADPDDVF